MSLERRSVRHFLVGPIKVCGCCCCLCRCCCCCLWQIICNATFGIIHAQIAPLAKYCNIPLQILRLCVATAAAAARDDGDKCHWQTGQLGSSGSNGSCGSHGNWQTDKLATFVGAHQIKSKCNRCNSAIAPTRASTAPSAGAQPRRLLLLLLLLACVGVAGGAVAIPFEHSQDIRQIRHSIDATLLQIDKSAN